MRGTQLCAIEKLQRCSLGEVFEQGEPAHSDGTLCSGPPWASSLLAAELKLEAFFQILDEKGGGVYWGSHFALQQISVSVYIFWPLSVLQYCFIFLVFVI